MATKASLLIDADAPSHIVYPCADENLIGDAVCLFAASGLRKGDAVVLVTTDARRKAIQSRLETEGFDIPALQATGQLVFLDAGALLFGFIRDGMPNAGLFHKRLDEVLRNCSPRKVRIFGEMVSLLYRSGNVPAAARLEEFWEGVVKTHSLSLFCAYSLELASDKIPQPLADAHSHDLSALDACTS